MSINMASLLTEAEKFKGDAYELGGAGPSVFDCSGLVQYSLEQLGVKDVPRTSEAQWAWVQKISASDLQVGDLVFAQFAGDDASPGHVGIYEGNGQVFSAQDPALGIGSASLSSWQSSGTIVGYGRVPGATGGGTSASTTSILGSLGALGSLASSASSMVSDLDDVATAFTWLSQPSHWFRIGMFFAGMAILGVAIWVMVQPNINVPTPMVVPV